MEGEEEGEEEEWRAQRIKTVFGETDDVVTLGCGQTYYFFKLPHKVAQGCLLSYQPKSLPPNQPTPHPTP